MNHYVHRNQKVLGYIEPTIIGPLRPRNHYVRKMWGHYDLVTISSAKCMPLRPRADYYTDVLQ